MALTLTNVYRALAWLVLVVLLVGADLIGNLSAYFYAVLLLASLPLLLIDPALRSRMMRWESGGYAIAFALLLVALCLSAQALADVQYAFNFIWFLLFIPAVALLSTNAGRHASSAFGALALLGSLVALLWALLEVRVWGIDRVVGFVNLTNPFAMAAVMLGFLAVVGFFARKDFWRLVFLLGPVFGTGAALLAGTRAAIVMVAVLTGLTFVLWSFTLDRHRRIVVLMAGAIGVALIVSLAVAFSENLRALSAFNSLMTFVGQGQASDFSTEIRLNLYYGGFRAFLESPIWGHGWWRHFEAARPYMSEIVSANTVNWSHLHNDYINFAALAGVMGLGAYLLYMLIPVAGALRSVRDTQYLPRLYGCLVLAACYATFGLFDTSFSMEILMGFGPVCAAALLGYCRDVA